MKKIIILILFLILGLSLGIYGNSARSNAFSYGISVTTDKVEYSIGTPIEMALKIFNYTDEDVTFNFNTSQRYDFIIEDEKGKEIWCWSKGYVFCQVFGKETLGPNNPEIIYGVLYPTEENEKLKSGRYKIIGIFIAKDKPMSSNIFISIK